MSIVANHFPEVLEEVNAQDAAPRARVRKPRVKPERRIRLAVPLNADGANGIVSITVGKDGADYYLNRIPSDWGQGFSVEKIGESEDVYHVNLDGENRSCSCKGHARWGHCKHADGIAALQRAGKL